MLMNLVSVVQRIGSDQLLEEGMIVAHRMAQLFGVDSDYCGLIACAAR